MQFLVMSIVYIDRLVIEIYIFAKEIKAKLVLKVLYSARRIVVRLIMIIVLQVRVMVRYTSCWQRIIIIALFMSYPQRRNYATRKCGHCAR